MSTAINARQQFLRGAATLLQEPAPLSANDLRHEVSLIQIATGNTGSGDGKHDHHCAACGSLDVVAREVDLNASKRQKQSTAARSLIIRKCQTCSRSVKRVVDVHALPTHAASASTSSMKQDNIFERTTNDTLRVGTKTSSKKRAKDRKDREGLKAMLDKNNAKSASSASAFHLTDFLSSSGQK